ncbi:hypothetical protein [Halocatena pleomorpha]|uniref:Uncharacterized protein n=1 Tax=Halocatena pleomorpha TaxID=1785090 RepID=A0A3P3R8K1_9EURY|nr:hypothetical protein [Halocatena pleomorpha]RRJ28970.1 hypothetical protein EIK79_14760 [Halocatena pleomorpha]
MTRFTPALKGGILSLVQDSDTVAVERVVQFNMTFKHRIDGPEWEPWKAYLIEEPEGRYRLNVVESEGDVSRTINHPAPSEIVVE